MNRDVIVRLAIRLIVLIGCVAMAYEAIMVLGEVSRGL